MRGLCIWFTGFPSSGKTTLAEYLCKVLQQEDLKFDHLDGDELRKHFTRGVGFSKEDRIENCKRISLLAAKIAKHGGISVVSLVSPYVEMRDYARELVEAEGGTFIEVFVDAPIDVCIQRDVKGLYKKALAGEVQNFTGVSDPYEPPTNPDIHLKTSENTLEECLNIVKAYLASQGFIGHIDSPRALFIGRWQPFHNGHDYIIRKKLDEGIPVLIGVRDTPVDEQNPLTLQQRIDMIRAVYVEEDVRVIGIPDIESVNIGRGVGYGVNEYIPPDNIAGISATEIRKLRMLGDNSWKHKVPHAIAEILDQIELRRM